MAHDDLGNLAIAQGLAPYAYQVAKGDTWNTMIATPIAAIVALPTTLANLEVKNNTTKAMIVQSIWAWQLLGTAVTWGHVPWAQVGAAVQSAVTGLVVHSQSGKASYTSAAGTDAITAITQTVVARGWQVFPGSTAMSSLAAATPVGVSVGTVDGRLVVPPGMALHVAVSGSVNTASAFHCGASWTFADITVNP